MKNRTLLVHIAMLLYGSNAFSQMVETYSGHKRAGVDLMWFSSFKNKEKEKTPWLFFSRNRASVEYPKLKPNPIFASTNAISYNMKNGLGFVAVGSFLYNGFTPKVGIQYVKLKENFLFFGWLVMDLKKQGGVDLFGMMRYQPSIGGNWRLLGQLEVFPVFNTSSEVWNLTERIRLGVKHSACSIGAMLDFNQFGKTQMVNFNNLGAFIRYEF